MCGRLTNSQGCGSRALFLSSSSSQIRSDSDRILSSLLQTCQCIHCLSDTGYSVGGGKTTSVRSEIRDCVGSSSVQW